MPVRKLSRIAIDIDQCHASSAAVAFYAMNKPDMKVRGRWMYRQRAMGSIGDAVEFRQTASHR